MFNKIIIPQDSQNVNIGAFIQKIGASQFHNNMKINGSINNNNKTKYINNKKHPTYSPVKIILNY